jgi:hypothetical protein
LFSSFVLKYKIFTLNVTLHILALLMRMIYI